MKYTKMLEGLGFVLPIEQKHRKHVYHIYGTSSKNRDKLQKFLLDEGIKTSIHYPLPIHLQLAYKDLGLKKGSLPNSEKASQEVLSLPIYPELKEGDVVKTCEAIKRFAGNSS